MNNTTDETPIRANMVKFKLGIDDYIRNINRPKDIGVICFEHVNGLTTENNHTNGFCTYKLNDRPSDPAHREFLFRLKAVFVLFHIE